ncbi:MAG: glycyl-radical enzyme activating protein [Dehalococcoidia bacterium]|nr:glycyl-radical enzyme activating protein [Dehalococcoidia bacterium]
MKGLVFDIQYYSLYDGPGIRSTIFLKGCPLRCLWCHNPESQSGKAEMSYYAERCARCGTCVKSCPQKALTMTDKGVRRDRKKCIVCGKCAVVCPNDVIQKIGLEYEPEEITPLVSRDKDFYDTSRGGVTVSGGEPTVQVEFLFDLLRKLKAFGIHTAVETCGYFKKDILAGLEGLSDLILFDLKHNDSEKHQQFTGVGNERILENFCYFVERIGSERIIPRIPVIPGFNADAGSISRILSFLKSSGYKGPVHLMPYNKMAKTKYEKIGRGSEYCDMGELTETMKVEIAGTVESYGYEPVVNQ